MSIQYYTYLHCKPDGTPFYVGKGCDKWRRRRSHTFASGRNKHHQHIVSKYGKENIGVFVFPCESENQAFADEVQQIAQLRKEGYSLCNMTNGGEGTCGLKSPRKFKVKMLRRSFWVSNKLFNRITAASKKTGMPMVEIIRRATDKALMEIESK